jgi:tRNA pseudouridine55 synthase
MYSAVRVNGERLYAAARRGREVTRAARTVRVHSLELLRFRPESPPRAALEVQCSGGTYVRSLAADLGNALGCGAYLSCLVRTEVGPFTLEESITLEEAIARPQAALRPVDWPLRDLPAAWLGGEAAAGYLRGRPVVPERWEGEPAGWVRVYGPAGVLLGIGQSEEGRVAPKVVLARGDLR